MPHANLVVVKRRRRVKCVAELELATQRRAHTHGSSP
jgi:hypothetical protein